MSAVSAKEDIKVEKGKTKHIVTNFASGTDNKKFIILEKNRH